jgi:uncharacterized glyoxalase superfamily protein PhnB
MTAIPPHGSPRIVPQLTYEDVPAAVDWLSAAFGFREIKHMRMTTPDGSVHAEIEFGGGLVLLGTPSVHGQSPKVGVSSMLVVYVADVDGHCARARSAGATIVLEPEDQFYGDRRYQAADPEGHQWAFHQPLGRSGQSS